MTCRVRPSKQRHALVLPAAAHSFSLQASPAADSTLSLLLLLAAHLIEGSELRARKK
uniref:Uncharacterized protein n=1 Tax=Oryza brachyantha TaxID=4533 RepID=J3LIN7_ORYBR